MTSSPEALVAPGPASALNDWLAYLEALHPTTIDLGLERVRQVFERLQLDFSGQQIVTIGGTNGKGSSVAMLAALVRAAGHSVGTYTSPHLLRYNERVSINGRLATDSELSAAFAEVEAARAGVTLTYFEFGTLAALVLFARQRPEYMLLEVGLGGRLDAVNIVDPSLSILTNVAMDHMDWLGDTRDKIGFEKAGIFRADGQAIYGERDMPDSVRKQAEALDVRLCQLGRDYDWQRSAEGWQWQGHRADGEAVSYSALPDNGLPLDNAAGVLQAIQFLPLQLSVEQIRSALAEVSVPGRFQQLEYQGRQLILDVAHNPHAASYLASRLKARAGQQAIHLVLAMLGDKDSAAVVKLLAPLARRLYLAPLGGERGAPVDFIYNQALQAGAAQAERYPDVEAAFRAALAEADADSLVVVTGSFFTVAAVLEMI